LEVMPRAGLVQNFHKLVTRTRRAEQRTTTIATEGNEMKIAAPIEALQTVAHKQTANCKAKLKTAPGRYKDAAPTPTSAIYEN